LKQIKSTIIIEILSILYAKTKIKNKAKSHNYNLLKTNKKFLLQIFGWDLNPNPYILIKIIWNL